MSAPTDDLNNAWSYVVDQCTRFVAGLYAWIPAGLGNANQWIERAREKGLATIGPTLTPPVGSVAVWNTGGFGHVAAVVGSSSGGFVVREENFLGLGQVDTRAITNVGGLLGFILPPGGGGLPGLPSLPNPADAVGGAVSGAVTGIGHGLADALAIGLHDAQTFVSRQIIALGVAAIVLLVLFHR